MSNFSNNLNKTSHALYSTGYVFDEVDYFESLSKISKMTKKTLLQVQERILCCKTKRLRSSSDLNELMSLRNKLKDAGLDVYIEAL